MASVAAKQSVPPSEGRKRRPPVNEIETRPSTAISKKGTAGTPVQLQANYFKLRSKPDWCLYQYRVDIAPEEDRTFVKKSLLRVHRAKLGSYLFDGTTLYTTVRLPQLLEFNSIREEDKAPMNIKIRLVGDVVKGDYHYFQLFNLIVRKCLEHLNLQLVGRNYYDASAMIDVREYRLQLWPGYMTSIRQHEQSILMCAEISHKIMRNQTLLEVLNEVYRTSGREYKNVYSKEVENAVVLTDYNNRTYRIDDVDYSVNPGHTFSMRDGSEISYAQYYKNKYQITIRDMKQPMLVSRSSPRERRAGNSELIYLIPELCCCTGLTDNMRNDFNLMRALATHTQVAPRNRIQKLMNFNRRLNSKPEIIEEFRNWNFALENDLVNLQGRILPQQTLTFSNLSSAKVEVPIKNADWSNEITSYKPFSAIHLKDWSVVALSRSKNDVNAFVKQLITVAGRMSFTINTPQYVFIRDDASHTYTEALDSITTKTVPQLILCVVPNNQLQRYAAIKKKLLLDRAILSQLILQKNVFLKDPRKQSSVCAKLAIQMNCKIGGAPWGMQQGRQLAGSMVVGFDVCHDKAAKSDYGALVASLDVNFTKYYSAPSHHPSGEELSNDISLQLHHAIVEFFRRNQNRLPSRIIIYRDGVGEGQIPFVYDYEIGQIKKMLSSVYKNIEYKLGFIVVTKRINTRIFLKENNPPSGTVVDDVITDPLKYDFFIVSQKSNQGTVTPTAYNVIHDNLNLKPDELQQLTFKLCHGYYNYCGPVRVPAPCQYAHKLALFVSQALKNKPNSRLNTTFYYL